MTFEDFGKGCMGLSFGKVILKQATYAQWPSLLSSGEMPQQVAGLAYCRYFNVILEPNYAVEA